MQTLMTLHRWLGVIACLAIFTFAGSGLLHPLLSRTQPQPAQFSGPRAPMPAGALSLPAVLRAHGIENLQGATLALLERGAAYRVQTEQGGARYFDVHSGTEIENGEREHARQLARHFLGDRRTAIDQLTRIGAFDAEYPAVNRLLPVWRAHFDRADGMTVYVDTEGNRLATLVDGRKRVLQNVFRRLHNFSYLDALPGLRLPLMFGLLVATASTSVAGLIMFVKLRRAERRLQRLPARRWHRRLSLAIGASALGFTVSGGWHLLQQTREIPLPSPQTETFASSELGDFIPAGDFTLLRVGVACYRTPATPMGAGAPSMMMEHHHPVAADHHAPAAPMASCVDTRQGAPIADAESVRALTLARRFARSEAAVAELEAVTRFGDEYGFINKRLPVWKVRFADSETRWYVENSSGALALRADDSAAREGWVFGYFHKARFIGDACKDLRDGALIAFALGNLVVAALGLWLFATRYRKRDPVPAPVAS